MCDGPGQQVLVLVQGASLVAQMVKVCLQCRSPRFNPWVEKIPLRREWLPTPVFLPGESHGQRNLVGYSPSGRKELDITERPTLPLFLSLFSVQEGLFLFPAAHREHNLLSLL